MTARTLSDVIDEYLDGNMARGSVFSHALEVLLDGDIDAQLAAAPPETRDWLEWGLQRGYAPIQGRTADSYISIFGGTSRDPEATEARLEREAEEFRGVTLPRLQAWCRAHAPSAREPFPLAVVRGLHARVAADHAEVWARRPENWIKTSVMRAWPERDRESALSELEGALGVVLAIAEGGGPGSLEEALGWMGFERAAGGLATRADLTAVERGLVDAAKQRRDAQLASVGQSPPGTPGVIPGDFEP